MEEHDRVGIRVRPTVIDIMQAKPVDGDVLVFWLDQCRHLVLQSRSQQMVRVLVNRGRRAQDIPHKAFMRTASGDGLACIAREGHRLLRPICSPAY